ncbi:tetratricopeptide repeat protein [Roseibacillus ishigakijimensis]|uniref:Tetratricopeptide repeat protein n=1 Tax=Roseibacillus ishigakijimensis TaxID=454146 RepID=A0A934VKZ2_9BACT|nr:tetratricopeptide repeat protein [Roseibacillus ishigakijimensis]MBK1834154.1 tetratricopeptide repeat protein [Roseibacillus ishigakijimensis]
MTRLFLALSLLATGAFAAPQMPLSQSYWQDPAFLKEFNGSYRINANIEPVLTSEERGLLRDIQSLMSTGQRTNTINKLKASPLVNTSPAVQFNLANVLSENGRLEEAIVYYRKAIKELPSFRRAHQNLAYALFREGEVDEAYDHLLETVRLGGGDGSVHGLLGHCFQQKGQPEAALLSFRQALVTQPETTEWKIGVAHSLQQLNRSAEALAHYESLEEKSDLVHLQIALLHNELGQPGKALAKLEVLRRKEALDADYEILLGTLLLNHGNPLQGASVLKDVIGAASFTNHPAALNAVRFSLESGHRALAGELHELVKTDELSPAQSTTHRRLQAQLLLAQAGEGGEDAASQKEEGLALLRELVTANPTDSHSLLLLGQQQVEAGENRAALLTFEQAIHAEGSHSPQAMLAKVQTHVALQEHEQAIPVLKDYLAINDDPSVRDYLSALENIVRARTVAQ